MADPPDKSPSGDISMTSLSSGCNRTGGLKPDVDTLYEKRNGTGVNKPVTPTARDRWGRLKSTVAATTNISSKKKNGLDRGDSFLRKFSTRNQVEETIILDGDDNNKINIDHSYRKHQTCGSYVIHPSGGLMFYWLGAVTLTVLYNLWTCIAREAFREIQEGYMLVWFSLDALADFIYVCDTFVQFRTGYLQQGLMVYDTKKLCINYMKSKSFIIDLLCLLPLDFVQFYTGIHPMIRFPRFLKIYRSFRFMHMYESRTAYPNLLRVLSLSHILFLGSHWFAAFYYLISEAEGFEGRWSYPEPEGIHASVTRKYLASLYWSTLTLTTIGDLPPPDTNWQYVFVIVSYLIGVFIFATIVGQVGNVITNRNASRQEFERLLDGAKFYMQMHNVPTELQKRVQRWYDYVWTRGRLNCNDINSLGLLPDKLKTELALHVNLGTLRKVTIFQKCRPEFLHDLMLKMRAYIFTPGDLICRRGEVAREMFIIADGVVEIIGENSTVLTQMSTGDFFGEIGILNLDGGINRRTADVRSVGYAELFVLSREDVLAALKDHPDAEEILHAYARIRLEKLQSHRTSEDDRVLPSLSRSTSEVSELGSVSRSPSPDIKVFIDSSNSSDSEPSSEEDQGEPPPLHTIPIRPSARDSECRKSSPSILTLPSSIRDRLNRRISLPPPLDLPIEVPKFSNFHGLSRNSSDVSHTLNRFKDIIERRMDHLESSYKETMAKLDETTKTQERFMKTIIKKLTSVKTKDRFDDSEFTDKDGSIETESRSAGRHSHTHGYRSKSTTEDKIRDRTLKAWGAKSIDSTCTMEKQTHKTTCTHSCGHYSSSSSTESQGHVTYAMKASLDNTQHSSSFDELLPPYSNDRLANQSEGARASQSFQVHDGPSRQMNDTTTDDLDSSGNYDFSLDDRVTHL